MAKTYPDNSIYATHTSTPPTTWPYAVKVEQVAGAGAGMPTCLGPEGQNLGDFSVADETQLGDCLYLNTRLESFTFCVNKFMIGVRQGRLVGVWIYRGQDIR